jgi:hypothetical protein
MVNLIDEEVPEVEHAETAEIVSKWSEQFRVRPSLS